MTPTSSNSKRQFAVFDVDWTMHPSALGTSLIHELLKEDIIQADFDIESIYQQWQSSDNPGVLFMSHYYELFQKLIGVPKAAIRSAALKVSSEAADNIFPFINSEIKKHQREGRFLLMLSNSPSIALEYLAEDLAFDDYSGGNFEFDEDGLLHNMHSTSNRLKSDELKRLIAVHNLDLQGSYGYGDSLDDIGMLEMVENPIAISPKKELLDKATSMNWRIVNVR